MRPLVLVLAFFCWQIDWAPVVYECSDGTWIMPVFTAHKPRKIEVSRVEYDRREPIKYESDEPTFPWLSLDTPD
jgi:hypothetical protein